MKKSFSRKNIIWTGIAVLIIVCIVGSTTFSLTQQSKAQPENPIDDINLKRSQKLVAGSGYSFDKEQEENYKRQEKQREKKYGDEIKPPEDEPDLDPPDNKDTEDSKKDKDKKKDENPTEIKNPGDDKKNKETNPNPAKPTKPAPPTQTAKPKIWTTLKSEYGGNSIDFRVKGTDYKDNLIPEKGENGAGIQVSMNGSTLQGNGTSGGKVNYFEDNLKKGTYKLTIVVTDAYKASSSLTRIVKVDPGKEKTRSGTITVSLEAGTIGKPMLISPEKVDIFKGEPLYKAVYKVLDDHGYTVSENGQRISKAGITSGYSISSDLIDLIMSQGGTLTDPQSDSLGAGDITSNSSWIYFVNEETSSLSIIPSKKDNVRIRFSLWNGYDLGYRR